MANVTCDIDKLFTSKRAKQFVKGLQGLVCNHNDGLMEDERFINAVVQKSLQMLVSANVVKMKKGGI